MYDNSEEDDDFVEEPKRKTTLKQESKANHNS